MCLYNNFLLRSTDLLCIYSYYSYFPRRKSFFFQIYFAIYLFELLLLCLKTSSSLCTILPPKRDEETEHDEGEGGEIDRGKLFFTPKEPAREYSARCHKTHDNIRRFYFPSSRLNLCMNYHIGLNRIVDVHY